MTLTSPELSVHQGADGGTVVLGTAYRLEVDPKQPRAVLRDRSDGQVWTELSLLAGLDLVSGRDESYDIGAARVSSLADDAVELVVEASSSVWESKALHVLCTPGEIEVWARAAGPRVGERARLGEMTLLGGRAVLPNGAGGTFRSSIRFAALFSPTPTEPVHVVRPATSPSSLGVVGDAAPGRLHGIFSPPPLCWALGDRLADGATDVPDGRWWGLSLRAPVEQLTMTAVRYAPLDGGFVLRLDYEGHTLVDAEGTRTPSVVLRPAASPWQALTEYRDDLVQRGLAPAEPPPGPNWWAEPIFCGWGAQCARASRTADHADGATVTGASQLARQDVYDEFLDIVDGAGLDPGTIVIDDRWQYAYGTGDVDLDHWPDLRGWIAARHAEGRRVLLWWKAWDPQGVPVEECVTDPAGRPVAVDVADPRYRERLAGIVAHLLGPDGLDADGLKIDFTQRAPSGESLRAADGPWGIAALHLLLATISTAAKRAKSDALLVTHTPHPSFGDVCDMVRLNDVLERDVAGEPVHVVEHLTFRHAVAGHSLPGHLIDTDQWPMPDRVSWRSYVEAQGDLGPGAVPALYYLESIDGSGEPLTADDLALVATSWARYRAVRAQEMTP
ncbi:hypothetical protein [Jiangella asiatica]|uniref:Alpha-galactosidase n=1 Tax=Jiangella asiatica TaxID=2530372 RepID=A0A4V2Z3H0_9ACTN|nr:hypothetical protein [Jiangella asiatica]TDE12678.1 hypothetical protein E1269_07570 [Jiangella asiatica]